MQNAMQQFAAQKRITVSPASPKPEQGRTFADAFMERNPIQGQTMEIKPNEPMAQGRNFILTTEMQASHQRMAEASSKTSDHAPMRKLLQQTLNDGDANSAAEVRAFLGTANEHQAGLGDKIGKGLDFSKTQPGPNARNLLDRGDVIAGGYGQNQLMGGAGQDRLGAEPSTGKVEYRFQNPMDGYAMNVKDTYPQRGGQAAPSRNEGERTPYGLSDDLTGARDGSAPGGEYRVADAGQYSGTMSDASSTPYTFNNGASTKNGQTPSAAQGQEQQKTRPPLSGEHEKTRNTMLDLVKKGRSHGKESASALLEHYLGGSGDPVTVDAGVARLAPGVQGAEEGVSGHFENWFTGTGSASSDKTFGEISTWQKSGKPSMDLKGMNWESSGKGSDFNPSDANLTFGGAKAKGTVKSGGLTRLPNGDVKVDAVVEFKAKDNYNFDESGVMGKTPTPPGIAVGKLLTYEEIMAMEKAGGAKRFEVTSKPWERRVTGTITFHNGRPGGKALKWNDVR
ncbi:MAG: hypothetical protein HQL35_16265 [Alphaproteobacteria bacterium]|nr:hypothetical protein [Alphaproteobacteria bacterium]